MTAQVTSELRNQKAEGTLAPVLMRKRFEFFVSAKSPVFHIGFGNFGSRNDLSSYDRSSESAARNILSSPPPSGSCSTMALRRNLSSTKSR